MKQPILKSMVLAGAITMGIAACSSSPASGPAGSAKGAPLVIVDNTGQTFTRSFNPFVSTSIGNSNNTTALIYEPLLMFNIMQPTQPPIPWLATAYSWSNGGKTVTLTIRKGVKFSDGKPLTASDVAFSFNLLKNNTSLTPVSPPPIPVSATAPNATTAVLTFSQPEYANLFLIGGMYIVPQHVWQGISNPVTFADPNPVGTGPYKVTQFSAQKYTLTQNAKYWQLSKVHVPSIIFPNFVSNDTANPALSNGQIDYAGNAVSNVASNYLAKSPDFHTWTTDQPWFSDNNVVTLWLNVTKAPLNDPKVRLAISAGINRQQLSVQGETNYEPPATSSSGLLLPIDEKLLNSTYANDLKPTSDPATVTSLLKGDGWSKVNGKWTKNGQTIKFSIEDPSAYTDYATDAQLIATQLNSQGFDVSFKGVQATQWYADYPVGNFDAMIHWSNQGPNPYTTSRTGSTTRSQRRSAPAAATTTDGSTARRRSRPWPSSPAATTRRSSRPRSTRCSRSSPPRHRSSRCSTARPGMSTAPSTTPAGRPSLTSTTTPFPTPPTSSTRSCTSSQSADAQQHADSS
jgi:peptide/nickel transport system substrate-binding protein